MVIMNDYLTVISKVLESVSINDISAYGAEEKMLPDVIYDTYGPHLVTTPTSHVNLATRYTLSSFFDIPTISVGFGNSVSNIWSL